MKATHVRTIVKDENGVVIFRGKWRRISPGVVHYLKKEVSKRRAADSNGRSYHLVYSHPISDKQRKALEHGYRLRTLDGAIGSINAMMTRHGKELREVFPNTCYELEYAIKLLREISAVFREKGPL